MIPPALKSSIFLQKSIFFKLSSTFVKKEFDLLSCSSTEENKYQSQSLAFLTSGTTYGLTWQCHHHCSQHHFWQNTLWTCSDAIELKGCLRHRKRDRKFHPPTEGCMNSFLLFLQTCHLLRSLIATFQQHLSHDKNPLDLQLAMSPGEKL